MKQEVIIQINDITEDKAFLSNGFIIDHDYNLKEFFPVSVSRDGVLYIHNNKELTVSNNKIIFKDQELKSQSNTVGYIPIYKNFEFGQVLIGFIKED